MPDELVRLVVRGQGRRVEALLAREMTVVEAAGSLAAIAGLLQDGSAPPFTWRLVTSGGRLLESERSLAEEGVRDGQELILVAVDETIEPPEVDGVVARVARSQGRAFDASARLMVCSVGATFVVLWWTAMLAVLGGLRSLVMPLVLLVVVVSAMVVQSKALGNLVGARILAVASVVPFGEAGLVLGRRLGGDAPRETIAVAVAGSIVIASVAISWALPRSSWITLGYVALGLPSLLAGVVVEALRLPLVDLISGSLVLWSIVLLVLSGVLRRDLGAGAGRRSVVASGPLAAVPALAGSGRRHVEREQVLGMTIGVLVGMAACWLEVLLQPDPTDVVATAISVGAVLVAVRRAPNAGQTLAGAASLLLGGGAVVVGVERAVGGGQAAVGVAAALGLVAVGVMLTLGYWAGRSGDFRVRFKDDGDELPDERWVPPPGVLTPFDPSTGEEG